MSLCVCARPVMSVTAVQEEVQDQHDPDTVEDTQTHPTGRGVTRSAVFEAS